jgi:hypothetical protein
MQLERHERRTLDARKVPLLPLHHARKAYSVRTVFRVYLGNLTVALMSPSSRVVLLEHHDTAPRELSDYLIGFHKRSTYKHDLTKLNHLEYVLEKIRKDTGLFLWIEKYQLSLTPLLEAILVNTEVVEKGFTESFIVAGQALTHSHSPPDDDTDAFLRTVPGTVSSPTTVLEFSFDDAF